MSTPAPRPLLATASIAVALAAADTYVVVLALTDMMAGVGVGIDSLQRATPIISGFLLGGWQGVVIQVLIFAASIAIWFPFVKMQDKICLKQEQDAAAE